MNSRISWIIIITFRLAPLFHSAHAQEQEELNVTEIVLGHIGDSYEWHITDIGEKEIAIALPVIVYSKTTGWHCFSSSKLHHGAEYSGTTARWQSHPSVGPVHYKDDGRPSDKQLHRHHHNNVHSRLVQTP